MSTLDWPTMRAALPAEGLFAQREWLLSPEPYPLSVREVRQLQALGKSLHRFQFACDTLYRQSGDGRAPEWIARYCDAGKPARLLEQGSAKAWRTETARVLRPDLIHTEEGFTLTEIDSVPGGIGLTAWLNQVYAAHGFAVLGGGAGMLEGFAGIFPRGADIAISQESSDYRPEMEWLAGQLQQFDSSRPWEVVEAESCAPRGRDVYRFFELFDLPNLTAMEALLESAARGEIAVTAPPKPWLEEKLWLALFWNAALKALWLRGLSERHWKNLSATIPYGWVVDPTPWPHHAVLPRLEEPSWEAVAQRSQRDRDLVLKISGFSELAWGSKAVFVGSDLSQEEWGQRLREALEGFEHQPYLLQEFHKGKKIAHPYFDPESGKVVRMEGRVRLSPYYFVDEEGDVTLSGALATICPADKKLIHGMRDAIMVPCSVQG